MNTTDAETKPPEESGAEPRKMLDVNQLLDLVPLSKTSLWRLTDAGNFPEGHVVAGRKLWFADEVARWQRNLERAGVPIPGRTKRSRRGHK